MGRPKKENTEVVLTHTSVSIAQINNKWHLVKIKYNPNTGDVGDAEFIEVEDKADALYRFKISAADEVMPE